MVHAVANERPAVTGTAEISSRVVLFALFFFSGFCSLLYQVVWVRLAFAHFGVITPVLSLVLSVFMLGLGLGSVLGGMWGERFSRRSNISSAYLYGAAELIIGIGAFVVPVLFQVGEGYLLKAGGASSTGYLFGSAIVIVVAVLPWCIMMGATFPLMMAFIRQSDPTNQTSFSFLYLANVLGAMAGTAMTALVLVELFGFRQTSFIAAMINFSIAATSFALARTHRFELGQPAELQTQAPRRTGGRASSLWVGVILFMTGMTSLAMEVVWTRAFTFVLKTTIYSFAMILTTYLLATWIGSQLYRRSLKQERAISAERLLGMLCLLSLLPVVINDPRVSQNVIVILLSIVPFCLALGYLTPRLIDEYSRQRRALVQCEYCWWYSRPTHRRLYSSSDDRNACRASCAQPSPVCAVHLGVHAGGAVEPASAHDRPCICRIICFFDVRKPRLRGRESLRTPARNPSGSCRHRNCVWRGDEQAIDGEWYGNDLFDTDHQGHGASSIGGEQRREVRTGNLFRHGHDLPGHA
jgi:MFS family permease